MAAPARKQKRRLGKGLGSLLAKPVEISTSQSSERPNSKTELPSNSGVESVDHTPGKSASSVDGLIYIQTECITPNPRQPRQVFDEDGLSSLADSIKSAGLMQPIVVRRGATDGMYELVAGERRWRAAQLASIRELPAILKEIDDKTSAEWALIENLQREDLNPIDRAEAFDRLVLDFNATQKEIATQLGIDRSSVANFLRLNDLDDFAKDAVRDGRLSMGHAKVILGIPEATLSKAIASRCASEQWSVRELERQLKKRSNIKSIEKTDAGPLEMLMDNLGTQLGDHLGTQVSISLGKKKGSGKLTISFYSNEQFEGILDSFKFKPTS